MQTRARPRPRAVRAPRDPLTGPIAAPGSASGTGVVTRDTLFTHGKLRRCSHIGRQSSYRRSSRSLTRTPRPSPNPNPNPNPEPRTPPRAAVARPRTRWRERAHATSHSTPHARSHARTSRRVFDASAGDSATVVIGCFGLIRNGSFLSTVAGRALCTSERRRAASSATCRVRVGARVRVRVRVRARGRARVTVRGQGLGSVRSTLVHLLLRLLEG